MNELQKINEEVVIEELKTLKVVLEKNKATTNSTTD